MLHYQYQPKQGADYLLFLSAPDFLYFFSDTNTKTWVNTLKHTPSISLPGEVKSEIKESKR